MATADEILKKYGLGGAPSANAPTANAAPNVSSSADSILSKYGLGQQIAPPEPERTKSFLQKATDFVKGEVGYAVKNPVQAAKNIGKTFISGVEATGQDISAPFVANIYQKQNEANAKVEDQTRQRLSAAYKTTQDPVKKENIRKSLQSLGQGTQTDILKEVPALNKSAAQVYADFAGMGLDMFGASALVEGVAAGVAKTGVSALGKFGAKEAAGKLAGIASKAIGKDVLEQTAKETFFKSVVEGAGWGASYGGVGAAQQGGGIKEIATGAGEGAALGGIFAGSIQGITKAGGWGISKVASRFAKPAVEVGTAEEAGFLTRKIKTPIERIQESVTDPYKKHLVEGISDAKLATELLANGDKSPKVVGDIKDSFKHLGEDPAQLEKGGVFVSSATERSHAEKVVFDRMSPQAKEALHQEAKASGLFHEDTDKEGLVKKAVNSILANGKEARDKLPTIARYVDSVLGVVNPEIKQVEQQIADRYAASQATIAKRIADQTKMGDNAASQLATAVTEDDVKKGYVVITDPTGNSVKVDLKGTEITPKESLKPRFAPTIEGEAVSPKSEPQLSPDIKKIADESRKISEGLEPTQSMGEVMQEMEAAQAGKRFATKTTGQGGTKEWQAQESTFPKWVPEHLRDKSTFDAVQKHILDGTLPTSKNQLELYDIVHNEIRKREGLPEKNFQSLYEETVGKAKPVGEKPVQSTGKQKESQLYKHLTDFYGLDENKNPKYNVADLKENSRKALDLISRDRNKAMRIALGIEKSDDKLSNSVSLALIDDYKQLGGQEQVEKLTAALSLRATRQGQEIAALRGAASDTSPLNFAKQVIKERMDRLKMARGIKGGSLEKFNTVMNKEIEGVAKDLEKAKIKVGDAQKIIDDLTCK